MNAKLFALWRLMGEVLEEAPEENDCSVEENEFYADLENARQTLNALKAKQEKDGNGSSIMEYDDTVNNILKKLEMVDLATGRALVEWCDDIIEYISDKTGIDAKDVELYKDKGSKNIFTVKINGKRYGSYDVATGEITKED